MSNPDVYCLIKIIQFNLLTEVNFGGMDVGIFPMFDAYISNGSFVVIIL